MEAQDCLRPVDIYNWCLFSFFSCFADQVEKFLQYFSGKIAATPVEGECFAFLCSLQGALVDIFLLRKGKFLFFVVKMFVICAVWCRCDQRLMIPENTLIVKIK